MGKDLNSCNFIGRLGKDPEVRYLPSGVSVANFSIACGDDYKDKNGNKIEQTNWINCEAFGKLADIIGQYLTKGSQVHVTGKQVTEKWQGQDGSDKYTTKIKVHDMQMLGGKQSDHGGAQNQSQAPQNQGHPPPPPQNQPMGVQQGQPSGGFDDSFDDDIPFS